MLLIADPIIMMSPNNYSSKKDWEDYFTYLQDCINLIEEDSIYEVTLSTLCLQALYDSDRYPQEIKQLQKWLVEAGIVDTEESPALFDARTLVNLVLLLSKVQTLEEHLTIEHFYDKDYPDEAIWVSEGENLILIQQEEIKIDPEEILSRFKNETNISNAFRLTIGLLAYVVVYRQDSTFSSNDVQILTVQGNEIDQYIRVEATISDKEDIKKSVDFRVELHPKSIIPEIEDMEMLERYWDDIEKIFQERFPHGRNYVFSKDTIEYLQGNKGKALFSIDKLIDLLRSVVQSNVDVHVTPKNNHRLHGVENDGRWEAWRYHITRDSERLHYWKKQENGKVSVVFSRIVTDHDDFSIDPNNQEKGRFIDNL